MGQRIFWNICFIILSVSSCFAKTKIDLGFLVDDWSTSNVKSTTGKESEADAKAGESVKDLIRTIYGSFHVEDGTVRVGLVKSGPTAKVIFDFNAYNDLDRLDETVEQLNFPKSADSNIGKALDLVNYGLFKNSGRPEALKFLVVIAQAKSTDDVNRAARELRNSGVNILSAWSGNTIYRDDLQSIVSPPKHYNLFKDGGNSVDKLAPLIVRRIRYVASVSKAPKNIPKQKLNENKCSSRCDVKVKGGEKIKIDCSNCKLVACCDKCCTNENNEPFYPGPVELAILLDESGELKDWNNFNVMKSFIKNLTREFELKNKKTKVGLVSFTDTNLQLLDLHSYHDYNKIDLQIDKLNYEGIAEDSGELNKALDAAQANFFTGEQDLSVPRLLLVFDSATKKNDQTDVKAFRLQRGDVQKFCIGLGASYNKTNCRKIVEKPYKSHSISAKVEHLSELQEAIMLMIVNDIALKYCPLCVEGTNAACKPCETARHLIGSDDSKLSQNIDSEKILKLLKQGNGQIGPYKIRLKMSDSNDDDDKTKLGTNEAVKLLGGSQVATPLPSAELVKELLQSGTALNSDRNNEAPLIANDQNLLLQQNPASVLPEAMFQQSLQPQQFVQQELPQQQSLQPQQSDNVNNLSPQLMAPVMPLNDNQKTISPLLKSAPTNPPLMNQDDALDSPLTVQPVALNPKLLSQAILETERFQNEKSRGVPLGALSTLPVQNSDLTNHIASFQGNVGTSLPVIADADVSKVTQLHSSAAMPALQPPMQLGAPVRKTNWFGFPLSSAANKKSPFEDEYKYDINDKEGPFIMACKDLSDDCASYATDGGCEDFAPLSSIGDIKRMCKASCGLCDRNMKLGHKRSQTKKQNRHKQRKHKLHH